MTEVNQSAQRAVLGNEQSWEAWELKCFDDTRATIDAWNRNLEMMHRLSEQLKDQISQLESLIDMRLGYEQRAQARSKTIMQDRGGQRAQDD